MSSANVMAAVRIRGRTEPYYVYAPPYVSSSAGVRVLHLLAHLLNLCGESAWLYIPDGDERSLAPHLAGRLLTPDILATHLSQRYRPIVIYPEVVNETLDIGSVIVRYALNFPGHLKGPENLTGSNYVIAYTEEIHSATENCQALLYIPTSDPDFFCQPDHALQRTGVLAYAGKYVDVHGGKIGGIPELREVIHRNQHISEEDLRKLLRMRRAIYVYENTAIATEALLCGCAVVRVSNPHFDQLIGKERLGDNGYVDISLEEETHDLQSQISEALMETAAFRKRYVETFSAVDAELATFVRDTQALARLSSPLRFTPILNTTSAIENVTKKLHQWAITVRQHGWIRTFQLGMRRKLERRAATHL